MSDNRAFGYIYGSPENGHRFFGIKTEKAAAQVRKECTTNHMADIHTIKIGR